jgi:hypothetical protein
MFGKGEAMARDHLVATKLNSVVMARLIELESLTGRTRSDICRRLLTLAEFSPDLRLVRETGDDGPTKAA